MDIALMGNTLLRLAIRQNLVSFPSTVPTLMRCQRADILERVVQLYFVRGWSVKSIGTRYRLSKAAVQKLLSEWRMRAISGGYVQEIHPESIEELARAHSERIQDAPADDDHVSDENDEEFGFESAMPVWAPAQQGHGKHALSAMGGN